MSIKKAFRLSYGVKIYLNSLLWILSIFFTLVTSKTVYGDNFVRPVDNNAFNITQGYNNLNIPNGGYHTGIDYTTTNGNLNIYAAASGKVVLLLDCCVLAGD